MRVEDGAERRVPIHRRQGQPIDCAVAGDERDRPTVAEGRVVADRGVSVDAATGTASGGGRGTATESRRGM